MGIPAHYVMHAYMRRVEENANSRGSPQNLSLTVEVKALNTAIND